MISGDWYSKVINERNSPFLQRNYWNYFNTRTRAHILTEWEVKGGPNVSSIRTPAKNKVLDVIISPYTEHAQK